MKGEKTLRMFMQKLNIHLKHLPIVSHYELSDCVEKPEYYVLRVAWDLTGFRESSESQTFIEAVRPLMIFKR
jgi:hypothetical protein